MRIVPSANAHNVDLGTRLKHFIVIGVKPRYVILLALRFESIFVYVAKRVQLATRIGQISVYVVFGDTAHAYNRYFVFFHVILSTK